MDLFACAHRNMVKGDIITLIYHVTDLQYTHMWTNTFIILFYYSCLLFQPPPYTLKCSVI